MKYLDFFSLLDSEPAHIALFSTFQFDPDFFERRLLTCPTLKKARRIAVFMDAWQWQDLLKKDVHARKLNRRYLVVPVRRIKGVFHPKLNLILSESSGQVQCGSNNLTRSGCSSNLELINSIPFRFDEDDSTALQVASATLGFFERAVQDTEEEVGRIAKQWLTETRREFAPLRESIPESDEQPIRLVHTYDGPIWPHVETILEKQPPKQFFIVSPFHDRDGGICKRLSQGWPNAKSEFLVQQGYTNLPVAPLRKLKKITLAEAFNKSGEDASRRIHAKLFSWKSGNGGGCLVGSANFTTAAFEGRNVEACLLLRDAEQQIEQLFDKSFAKRPLPLKDFEPGSQEPPESNDSEAVGLKIQSAVLLDSDRVKVTYSNSLTEGLLRLRIAFRTPGELHPRKTMSLPMSAQATETIGLPDNTLSDCKGTLLAYLTGELDDGSRKESLPVWVIQEDRLTYESSGGSSTSEKRMRESGDGLPEYLEELGSREGAQAVADFLRRLDIRYLDGGGAFGGKRRFRVRIATPFQNDAPPEWLISSKKDLGGVEAAIYDFVNRHIKKKLQKHVTKGNINGMENFLDIFTTLVKVLYRWHIRKIDGKEIVKGGKLIGAVNRMLAVATSGNDECLGYLYSLWNSLGGDVDLLQEVCDENNFCGEVIAALLIVQSVRFKPGEVLEGKTINRPSETLVKQYKMVWNALAECDLYEPTVEQVKEALEGYRIFSEEEIESLLGEI